MLITAPAGLREQLTGLPTPALITACTRLRPGKDLAEALPATKFALRALAHRYQNLTSEIHDTDRHLHTLVTHARPDLLTITGVGPPDRHSTKPSPAQTPPKHGYPQPLDKP